MSVRLAELIMVPMDLPSSTPEPEPPSRVVEWAYSIPESAMLPAEFYALYGVVMAEAQLLEAALKEAIANDIKGLAPEAKQETFIDLLLKMTLGASLEVAKGTAKRDKQQKELAECVGFLTLVKMQWHANSRKIEDLPKFLSYVLERRNRVAHSLLRDVILKRCDIQKADEYLKESAAALFELRQLVAGADFLSSKMGSIATNGSSLPRVIETK
jgi:hypothetical protein